MLDPVSLLDRARRKEIEGDEAAAEADFSRSAEAARAVADPSTEVAALAGLVRIDTAAGRYGEVRAHLDAIDARLTSASVTPIARAEALTEASLVAIELGEDAIERLDEAIALAGAKPATHQSYRIQVRAQTYLAHAERLRGDYAVARTTLGRALGIAERGLGTNSYEVAYVLNAIGVLGKFSGDFGAASRAYDRAAWIIRTLYGEDHPDMAAILHNLAGLAHARGDAAAAEPLARQSVAIRERTLGPDHLGTILDRAGLAAILSDLHRDDEAAALLEQVLADLDGTVGVEHREYAVTLNNLAAIEQRRNNLAAAESRYRHALEIKARTQGANAPALATTLNNLGTVVAPAGSVGRGQDRV